MLFGCVKPKRDQNIVTTDVQVHGQRTSNNSIYNQLINFQTALDRLGDDHILRACVLDVNLQYFVFEFLLSAKSNLA